jgi:hypothetical protein
MSETSETATQGGASAGAEPAATATETATTAPAPAVDGAATETTEQTTEQTEQAAAASRADRRIAAMSARMAAQAAQIERLEAERQARAQQPQTGDPDTERLIEERVSRRIAELQAEQKVVEFKVEGAKLAANFQERCNDLIDMGCDADFSHILLQLPNPAQVAFALSEDPAAVEEMVKLKTPTARAIALGKYAATIEGRPAPMPRVSRAPAPPRTVNGSNRVEFNPYTAGNSADGNSALTDYYMKEQMRARGL